MMDALGILIGTFLALLLPWMLAQEFDTPRLHVDSFIEPTWDINEALDYAHQVEAR